MGSNPKTEVFSLVKKSFYRDSVQLMQMSETARAISGVNDVAILMATQTNKELLAKAGLLQPSARQASDSDLVIAFRSRSGDAARIQAELEELLDRRTPRGGSFPNLNAALRAVPDANLALVSVPGEYAAALTERCLESGLNVFLFSDHVPLADEVRLKETARSKSLLLMGPEAGTAIVSGVVLGFGNAARRGPVGLVGAAGTGIQEETILLDRMGVGVSHAIGVGGRDLDREVNGIMTIESLRLLQEDPDTKLTLLVTKSADPNAQESVLKFIESDTTKPHVICLLAGGLSGRPSSRKVTYASSLAAAALSAAKLANEAAFRNETSRIISESRNLFFKIEQIRPALRPEQKFIRGLFSGGTLCSESQLILQQSGYEVYSNVPLHTRFLARDSDTVDGHLLLDYGTEEFTMGRPHPIIDPTLRVSRLLRETENKNTAAVIFDMVLGFGVPSNIMETYARALKQATGRAQKNGRTLPVFVHVCATKEDLLGMELSSLESAGATVVSSNALATLAAWASVSEVGLREFLRSTRRVYGIEMS